MKVQNIAFFESNSTCNSNIVYVENMTINNPVSISETVGNKVYKINMSINGSTKKVRNYNIIKNIIISVLSFVIISHLLGYDFNLTETKEKILLGLLEIVQYFIKF